MELVSPAPEAPEQNTKEVIEEPEQQYTTELEVVSQAPQQTTTPTTNAKRRAAKQTNVAFLSRTRVCDARISAFA